ncbi:mRNA surveillance protein pelota [Halanaeroarchaeum sulfurireducens]|uniref:Protein pelota homolog n=1 Tax=Halanaeroarchaeum sulfurireducens TaxID=1604004 RepID=A0A0F7PCJ2_9EURY|nr:mRNA surveillance protein pelota [Halanaeroarchaeum sulfurireducens]AKH97895.1 peptide chain release factor pelota [Halanaeroarchaeum sulfurireducens]ALG82289.1 peptide chain release factor pelota [Halanaeroarchaeum sulfurireducens]
MHVSDRERKEGGRTAITLVPESLDDLWHLTYVLEPDDLVSGDTHRRIQRDDEQLRDKGGEREHMWVTLAVDEVEFHKFANRLRVSGVIEECSREDQLGLHHTLNVEERKKITVEKVWQPDQLDRIEEAVEAAEQPEVAIATVEEGEAHIHTVAQYGVDEYATFTNTTGKGEYSRARDELFEDLASALAHLEADAVILAGPGFTKRDALDYIEENDPELTEDITVVDTSAVGGRGVHEVLKRGAVDDVQEETRIAEESAKIDELMERMATDGAVAYGIDEVKTAADYGAIETLLVLDERLRQERAGEGDWDVDVNDLVETVDQQGGDVTVFSHEFDPGQQLRNLGGVAALLRYRLD